MYGPNRTHLQTKIVLKYLTDDLGEKNYVQSTKKKKKSLFFRKNHTLSIPQPNILLSDCSLFYYATTRSLKLSKFSFDLSRF